ncbi:MAG: hypothetical protein E7288_04065 [Lachnospiraceae bacterium]|nr:hypothetical protein [Lachnospiraceae bacterium]
MLRASLSRNPTQHSHIAALSHRFYAHIVACPKVMKPLMCKHMWFMTFGHWSPKMECASHIPARERCCIATNFLAASCASLAERFFVHRIFLCTKKRPRQKLTFCQGRI